MRSIVRTIVLIWLFVLCPVEATNTMPLNRLILIQHGEAVEEGVDPNRPISDEGRRNAERMAASLSSSSLRVGQQQQASTMLHSGKLRAEQTAEIFAPALGATRVEKRSGMGPNDDVAAFWQTVRDGQEGESVSLCGHLPFLNKLIGYMLCGESSAPVALSNAGPACLELDVNTRAWQIKWVLPVSTLPA